MIVNCGPTVTMIELQPVPGKQDWARSDMVRNFVKKKYTGHNFVKKLLTIVFLFESRGTYEIKRCLNVVTTIMFDR